jgi:hypothetical protein
MIRRRALYAGAALLAVACLTLGGALSADKQATARAIGEVLIGDTVVVRFRVPAGDQDPTARAETTAARINDALAAGAKADDFTASKLGDAAVIYAKDYIIARVEPGDAAALETTPEVLASVWRGNLAAALKEEPAPAATAEPEATPPAPAEAQPAPAEAPPAAETPPPTTPAEATASTAEASGVDPEYVGWENPATKWVPIFGLENTGLQLGAAQVAGPSEQVAKVKGVAEFQLAFRNLARIRLYVPVSSISTSLDRVQGVAVWATGGLEILNF